MSIYAIAWVFRQSMKSSADKFVLVALADNAGDDGRSFPSVETICRKTELNRKTVIAALDRLTSSGMIVDTGQRVGKTKSVKIYRLTWANEAVPDSEPVPKSSEAVPFFPEAVPFLPREPSENRKRNQPPNPPKGAEGMELLLPLWKNRLGAIFNRKPAKPWQTDELAALKKICPIDENELFLIERYYASERKKEKNICRTTLLRLMKYWPGEVDRASTWAKRADFAKQRRSGPAPVKGPVQSDADFKRVGDVARAEMERFRKQMKPGAAAPDNGK